MTPDWKFSVTRGSVTAVNCVVTLVFNGIEGSHDYSNGIGGQHEGRRTRRTPDVEGGK